MLLISVDLSVELQLYAVFKSFCLPKDPLQIDLLYIVFYKSPDNRILFLTYLHINFPPIATISNK